MELLGDVSFLDALEIHADSTLIDTPHIDVPGSGVHHGPRPYRSRKNRPCDFCRARKAACKITAAPPCILCQSYGKECTFNNETKRRRSIAQLVEDVSKRQRIEDASDESIHLMISPLSSNSAQTWSPRENGNARGSVQIPHQSPTLNPVIGRHSNDSKGFSFALNPTKSAVWVGDSGEADPWLCRRFQYGMNEECILSRITYQRIVPDPNIPRRQSINEDYEEPPLIFMLPDDALAEKGEPKVEERVLEDARKEITELIPDDVGVRMVKLFFRFVYPYFPVLSREHMLIGDTRTILKSLPLSLLAAIYATVLPFMLYDDYLATAVIHSAPSAIQLYRVCWMAINQEMHSPRLATLQACLLILQRSPTNRFIMDTPWRWSCTAWTVSLVNILGICKSCSGWTGLPAWERRLRGRLFWATYVMDKWSLLGAGMPSHISDDNFDVPEPTIDPSSLTNHAKDSHPTAQEPKDLLQTPAHFYHLVHLTVILSDILKAFYTIRATSQTAKNLALSLERAKPLRARLKIWKEASTAAIAANILSGRTRNDSHSPEATTHSTLKLQEDDDGETLDGNASLRLAYIVTAMTLYRPLLRAIENTTDWAAAENDDTLQAAGRTAILAGAKECAKEAVEFAEDLRSRGAAGVWDAFWHSWSRSNFALATSFLMRVLVNVNATPSARDDELNDVKNLIAQWRKVLRLMSGNFGNGMTSLALLRLEGDILQEPSLLRA